MLNRKENRMKAYEDFCQKISIGFCKNIKNINVRTAKRIWQQVFANLKDATKDSIIHVLCNMEEKFNFISKSNF